MRRASPNHDSVEDKPHNSTHSPEPIEQAASGPFELISPADCPSKWDEYVHQHEKGCVFHTSGMHQVFEATPKNTPWSKAAVNAKGEIVAMASAVRVKTVRGLTSRLASRSIWYCEPLCDETDQGQKALRQIVTTHDRTMRGRVLYSEIRPLHPKREFDAITDNGYEHKDYLNFIVDLTATAELEKQLSKSCRKQIRKCGKHGVDIELVTTPESIEEMFKLVQFSYNRAQVPLANRSLFQNALSILGSDIVEVRLARFKNEIVAAGITLKFKDTVYAWYGGSHRVTGLSPFAALTWDEIKSGSEEGFRFYDFGGAGCPDQEYGPREFKAKFGGELVNYGRYTKVDSPWKLSAAKYTFEAVKRIRSLIRYR